MRFRVAFIFSLPALSMAHPKRQSICDITLSFSSPKFGLTADMRKKLGREAHLPLAPKYKLLSMKIILRCGASFARR